MSYSVFEEVADYHRRNGDDYGSEQTRQLKYHVIYSQLPVRYGLRILDVGCGDRHFQKLVPWAMYKGIDLREGDNVLDCRDGYEVVIGNGVLYKLPDVETAWEVIRHMWRLTYTRLIFNSLSTDMERREGELRLDPVETFARCREELSRSSSILHGYLPHDFTMVVNR